MIRTPHDAAETDREDDDRFARLFLREPGWRVGLKIGSVREFCFTTAPGQDYYHRLHDGEIYIFRGDEKLCLACAERRGLLAFEPRGLREPTLAADLDAVGAPADYDVEDRHPGD
jgi:hypothetical protein